MPRRDRAGGVSGDFDGLVAAVTGGASGIGAAIAAELVRGGARVAVLDLRAEDVTDRLVGFRCDVADDASVRAAIQGVVDHFGRSTSWSTTPGWGPRAPWPTTPTRSGSGSSTST